LQILSFSPSRGPIGSTVTLIGDFQIVWKSSWNASTYYNANDVVAHLGTYYIARHAHSNLNPMGLFGWDLLYPRLSFKLGVTQIDPASLVILDSNTVQVTIPTGAVSGKFTVARNLSTYTTPSDFKLVFEPHIAYVQVHTSNPIEALAFNQSILPYEEVAPHPVDGLSTSPTGQTYTINFPNYCKIGGSNFGNIASVVINGSPTRFVVHNHEQITASIEVPYITSVIIKTTSGIIADHHNLGYGIFSYGLNGYGY